MNHTLALILMMAGSPFAPSSTPLPSTSEPAITTISAAPDARDQAMTAKERLLKRRRAARIRRQQQLQGGQQQAMDGLISLIQTNVAPGCWEFGGTGFSNGGNTVNGPGNSLQNAENLAELIQQTTQPLSWEINGGNGSISIFSN